MTYVLGKKSLNTLVGVHPSLVAVTKRAIQLTQRDFTVFDGVRTLVEQRELVRRGVSKTMNSKHLPQKDGFSHAVDLVPWIDGRAVWDWPALYVIADAVRKAAIEQGVVLTWGGVWDRRIAELPAGAEGMKRAVEEYTARRRKMGLSAFTDGPHFELGAKG